MTGVLPAADPWSCWPSSPQRSWSPRRRAPPRPSRCERESPDGRSPIYDPENGVSVNGETDKSIALKTIVSWWLDSESPVYAGLGDAIDPRCIRPLAGGSVLVVNAGLEGRRHRCVHRRRRSERHGDVVVQVLRRPGPPAGLSAPSASCATAASTRSSPTVTRHASSPSTNATKRHRVAVWGRRRSRSRRRPALGPLLGDLCRRGRHRAHRRQQRQAHRVIEVRWDDYRGGRAADAWLHRGEYRLAVRGGGRVRERGRSADEAALSSTAARASHTLITDADAHTVYRGRPRREHRLALRRGRRGGLAAAGPAARPDVRANAWPTARR